MNRKIAVIGLGSIGTRHFDNLMKLGCGVRGYDPKNGGNDAELGELGDWADAIVIASPTSLHRPHLAWAGKLNKPIFCEKPVADVKIVPPDNLLMVGYNLRFHQVVQNVRAVLDRGDIGHPFWATFIVSQKSIKPAYLRDGVVLNWSHEIDLALHLLGPARVLASSTHSVSHYDDISDIILLHDSGCRSVVHLDYLGNPEDRRFQIHGSKGDLHANLITPRFFTVRPKGDVYYAKDSFDENYQDEMKAFLDRIDGKETHGCTREEAIQVLDICLEVRQQAGLP